VTFIKDMPNPTPADLADPVFQAIWSVIKDWDVNVPDHYEGYSHCSGSHVKLILEALSAPTGTHNDTLVRAVEALREYGNHKGAGTDSGCAMWTDECWCGYGVELQELEVAVGLPVTRPVTDGRPR
jgi:hypothetical protein